MTKHIEIQAHFVRDKFSDKIIDISHISTDEQPADGFIKPLGGSKFERFIKALKLRGISDEIIAMLLEEIKD